MNISSISSVEENSSNHKDGSKERAPKSRITFSFNNGGSCGGRTFRHGSSESWGGWVQRGSFTHPGVCSSCIKSFELEREFKRCGGHCLSFDLVRSSSGSTLEAGNSSLGLSGSCGSGGGGGGGGSGSVGSVGSVEHSQS